MLGWDRYRFSKCARTHYAKLVFLHPVGSQGHAVNSGASGTQNVDALFFMFERDWCSFHKKRVGTCYTKLLVLHLVGSAGNIVHFGASGQ
jgi:hypothetical protein